MGLDAEDRTSEQDLIDRLRQDFTFNNTFPPEHKSSGMLIAERHEAADEIERLLAACREALEWYDKNLDTTPVDWLAGREWTDPMMEALGEPLP